MANSKKRLTTAEVKLLSALTKGRAVVTSKGTSGYVTAITKGGIQVKLKDSRPAKAYPIFTTFDNGGLRFLNADIQNEIMSVLSKHTEEKATESQTEDLGEQPAPEEPQPDQKRGIEVIDVAGNVWVACLFKGIDSEDCRSHLEQFGCEGFEESLEKGFKGANAFQALKESSKYLGCGVNRLLFSFEEQICYVLDTCTPSSGWQVTAHAHNRSSEGKPYRTISYKSNDKIKEITLHAIFNDDCSRYSGIQCNFVFNKNPSYELEICQIAVLNPLSSTMKKFDLAFAQGSEVAEPSKPTANTQTAQAQRPVAKTNPRVPKAIHINEFLVRRSYGSHRKNGHSLQPVRATVSILPFRGGDMRSAEFDAYWCPKCQKYYMEERTFLKLKRQGYICCKVIEEKDLDKKPTGTGLFDNLADESILHMYGYTVSQQADLSMTERHTIISFVVENGIQTTQDIAHLLEWLISARENNPRMRIAVGKWQTDLDFVRHYHKPTRKVRVDSIYAKI